MGNQIVIDTSDLNRGIGELLAKLPELQRQATNDIAHEILRLSQFEVPHNIGTLQNSGGVDPEGDGAIVGYNTVYAARLHEHPEYHFQKGRKGKYLEDPLKNNLSVFLKIVQDLVN